MGGILGGGGGSGDGGGLLGGLLDPLGIFKGGQGGGLGGILGGLPDPLGIGKMLGITGQQDGPTGMMQPGGPGQQMPPPGAHFNGSPPTSGVSFNPGQMLNSPMGPVGFGIGGPGQGPPR